MELSPDALCTTKHVTAVTNNSTLFAHYLGQKQKNIDANIHPMLLKRKPSQEISTTNVGKCSKLYTAWSWAM